MIKNFADHAANERTEELNGSPLQRVLGAPGIRLMSVAQAEVIAKTVPGLKHTPSNLLLACH